MRQYNKTIMTTQQLVQSYIDAGMVVNSVADAERTLTEVGHYRLKGYCRQFFDFSTKKYQPGTEFDNIIKLYYFDKELSLITFKLLSSIEVSLRSRFSQAMLDKTGDALALEDPAEFENKGYYWANKATIAKEINRSSEEFIQYNYLNHEGNVPIWAIVEVMSFGTLSKVIKDMATGSGSALSLLLTQYKYNVSSGKFVTPSLNNFSSWVYSCSTLRNMCAHGSRLYNKALNVCPTILSQDQVSPTPKYCGYYQMALAMKYIRPSDNMWRNYVSELTQLIQQYSSVVDITKLNFPADWATHFIV